MGVSDLPTMDEGRRRVRPISLLRLSIISASAHRSAFVAKMGSSDFRMLINLKDTCLYLSKLISGYFYGIVARISVSGRTPFLEILYFIPFTIYSKYLNFREGVSV